MQANYIERERERLYEYSGAVISLYIRHKGEQQIHYPFEQKQRPAQWEKQPDHKHKRYTTKQIFDRISIT